MRNPSSAFPGGRITQDSVVLNPEGEDFFTKAERLSEKGLFREAHLALLEAAKLGHTGAQVTLGNNFSSGRGVPKSDATAAYWYRRAYRAGDESGALNIAIDKLRDHKIRGAILWLNRAVLMGSGEAALKLAQLYLERRNGRPKALELLERIRTMKPAQISDDAKEEAALLLSKTTARK